jgi:hypothetical protein
MYMEVQCSMEPVLEMNFFIKSNSWIYFYIVLNKNLPVKTKFDWSCVRGPVLLVGIVELINLYGEEKLCIDSNMTVSLWS